MLESPDSEIAREVRTVLKRWRCSVPTPEGDTAGLAVRGKLTYDLVREAGDGMILTPLEKAARLQRPAG